VIQRLALRILLLALAAALLGGCSGGLFRRSAPASEPTTPRPPEVSPAEPAEEEPPQALEPEPELPPPASEPLPEPEPPEAEPLPEPPAEQLPPPSTPGGEAAGHLVGEGRKALGENRTSEAVVLLEQALRVDPNRAETYVLLAEAYRRQGRPRQGVNLVSRAELLAGGEQGLSLEGLLVKGDCLRDAGQGDEARAVYVRAAGRAPANPEVKKRLSAGP
jgi:tetratricopeptide (TPR) repeat protein